MDITATTNPDTKLFRIRLLAAQLLDDDLRHIHHRRVANWINAILDGSPAVISYDPSCEEWDVLINRYVIYSAQTQPAAEQWAITNGFAYTIEGK